MLVLVWVIELVVGWHAVDLSHPSIWDWRQAASAARAHKELCPILCFGDSQVKWGIQARVLEQITGTPSFNYAVLAGQAPTTYFQLRRVLESGPAPASVLVNFAPFFLAHHPRINVRRWPEMLSACESLELAWDARDAGFFASISLARLLPSLRQRDELRAVLRAALRGEKIHTNGMIWGFRRNFYRNRGSHAIDHDPRFTGQVDGQDAQYVRFPEWRCDPINARYVERLLTLAQRRGIRVFWLIPPMSPGAQAKFEENGSDARYVRFVRDTARRYPTVSVIDGRHSGYDHTVFCDALHLDHHGARVFTTEVATLVAALSQRGITKPAENWLALPPYRDGFSGDPVETLSESMLALKSPSEQRSR